MINFLRQFLSVLHTIVKAKLKINDQELRFTDKKFICHLMSLIATSSNELKLHHWPEVELLNCYKPTGFVKGPIQTISWCKNGSSIVLVPCFGAAEIISTKDNVKLLHVIEDVHRPTCAIFQNYINKSIALGTLSGQVLIYDIESENTTKYLSGINSYPIANIVYNSRDTYLAASCTNGEILLFNSITTNLSSCFVIPDSESVSAMNFHRTKRNMLVAGSDEGIIAAWDTNTNIILSIMQVHQGSITDVAFSPLRSDLLVTSGLDRKFYCHDIVTNKPVIEIEVASSATSLDFSFCGNYLGLGSENGNVVLYDVRKFNRPLTVFTAHEGKKIQNLAFQKVSMLLNDQDDMLFGLLSAKSSNSQGELNKNQLFNSLDFGNVDLNIRDDSFLIALGFKNCNQQFGDKSEDVGAAKSVEDLGNCVSLSEDIFSKQDKPNSTDIVTDVPTMDNNHLIPDISHSINYSRMDNSNIKCPAPDDLKELLREIVKAEFRIQNEKFKKDLAEMCNSMRRFCLDIQMSLIKELVYLEQKINKISNNS